MFRAQNLRKNCSPRAGAFLRNHELHNDGILGESHPSWKNVTGKIPGFSWTNQVIEKFFKISRDLQQTSLHLGAIEVFVATRTDKLDAPKRTCFY